MAYDSKELWYHTIDLPDGVTPGEYDLRSSVGKLPFPADLSGMRCLDVGTHDGFWAFEMERRGAADVLAIDIEDPGELDWPEPRPALTPEMRDWIRQRKKNFERARSELGSSATLHYMSVYELTPESVGEFDFVFIGTLLHHLRDPVGALMSVRKVVRGYLLISAVVSLSKSLIHRNTPLAVMADVGQQPFWQVPNRAGLRHMVVSAGYEVVREGRLHVQRRGPAAPPVNVAWKLTTPLDTAEALVYRYAGMPHMGILVAPVGL